MPEAPNILPSATPARTAAALFLPRTRRAEVADVAEVAEVEKVVLLDLVKVMFLA